MPSEEEQQPGPSGVSREELSSLLGLNVTNDDEEETFEEEEKEDPWGLPILTCCRKKIHMECLESHLGDGTRCPNCRQTLFDLMLSRVHWRFRNIYRMMFSIHIADEGHLEPGLRHKWNFLEPWGGQWMPK